MKGVQVDSVLISCENGASHEDRGWKLVTSGTQRMAPAPLLIFNFLTCKCHHLHDITQPESHQDIRGKTVTLLSAGTLCFSNTIISNADITGKSERGKITLLVLRNNETFFKTEKNLRRMCILI